MSDGKENKKIVSDDDWKVQAKHEKEKIGEKEKDKEVADAADGAAGPMPPASFMTLVNSLTLQSLLYMGKLSDPSDKEAKSMVNLELAKHHIDLLGVLEEKTKGNLGDEESKALSLALHEVRMQYVQSAG